MIESPWALADNVDTFCPVDGSHPLASGLVSFWLPLPMNGWSGGDKLRDIMRGLRKPDDGTLTNAPTWTAGQNGFGALSLNGTTQGITVPDNNTLDFGSGNITMTAVVKFNSFATAYQAVMLKGGTGRAYMMTMYDASTTYNQGVDASPFRSIGAALSTGVWYHLCAIRGTTNSFFFVDGVQRDTDTRTSASDNAEDFTMGLGLGGFGHVNGTIAEGKLYNRELSASEVKADYLDYKFGRPALLNRIPRRAFGFAAAAGGNRRRRVICGAAA